MPATPRLTDARILVVDDERVNVVLLHLPDMPGQEVLRRLRAQARTANVPVVILSADARPALIKELLAQGVRAFLDQAAGRPRAAEAAGRHRRRAAAAGRAARPVLTGGAQA